MVREVPLTQGKVALVDDEDYARVAAHKWSAVRVPTGQWYAKRTARENGRPVTVLLHRCVARAERGELIDHENRDGLDCRRGNLRRATRSQNMANSPGRGRSGFKGVCFVGGRLPWRAALMTEGRRVVIGHFASPADAAAAYDHEATVHFGAFAWLNFPEAT